LGMGFFLVGNLALSVFGLFLFCFCLARGEQATDAQGFLVGNVFLVTILYCSYIFWSKDTSVYFLCFHAIFDRRFPFFFLSFFSLSLPFLIGNFLSFFAFSLSFIGDFPSFCVFSREQGLIFSPWFKVYGKLGFWLEACSMARYDICQGLV